jgi:hypothetical protein
MLIATFGPTTARAGTQITYGGDTFSLEGLGPISAVDIMEYDRQGDLLWVNDGARAWVGSKAERSRTSNAASSASTATLSTGEAAHATRHVGSQPSSRKATYLKRFLLLAIIVLIAANVVLVLIMAGVLHVP